MKALLVAGIFGIALTSPTPIDSADDAVTIGHLDREHGEGLATIQKEYHGWVNPEDLVPMPQCIAQQDQSTWLKAMTQCTHQRCTSHFGFICTHHQWLTQLSCLSAQFSPSAVESYLPYCSRSILAKAQLYRWIRTVTDRTWLVEVGDAIGLEPLSPTSLTKGYASLDVVQKAPTCLINSLSTPSKESFQGVLESCSFTDTTLHTGNAGRPWEYDKGRRSLVSLSFDTVGYDLTNTWIPWISWIPSGKYFDRQCFCSTFAIDQPGEPCFTSNLLDLTMERLWLNATCGPTSLPDGWTASLKIQGLSYIPLNNWKLPLGLADMPKKARKLTQQCTTSACHIDSDGYCQVEDAIDRACFCRSIDYSSCQGPCQLFEARKNYVQWLHDLCGHVEGWHGLPQHWHMLLAPRRKDLIPWQWTIQPESTEANGTCPSNTWKLGSITLVQQTTLLGVFINTILRCRDHAIPSPLQSHRSHWILGGLLLASVHLFANWINATVIQKTHGYENVPVFQLMLLWCSLPRLTWLTIPSSGIHRPGTSDLFPAASALFAEMVLQGFSLYYMTLAVNYGQRHNFYFGSLTNAENEPVAWMMYAGALLWLIVVVIMAVPLIRTMRILSKVGSLAKSADEHLHSCDRYMAPENNEADVYEGLLSKSRRNPSSSSDGGNYGTLPAPNESSDSYRDLLSRLYMIVSMGLPLLWVAQWLFWVGFVVLSSEDFCLPSVEVLTAVWMVSSLGFMVIKSQL